MDFMKVLDQTVREIKREVNLKVLKVPETEQKVLDATSDEPWGPHGSALSEIAQATKKFTECQMIMNVLWTRLSDTGSKWRHVYKALAVIEYLVANGSERAVDDILEHAFQISALSGFEYVEPNGKDVGINVRKKAETILALLNDKEKIQAVREKAAATRDKYFGLSSTGITYKSSGASYSGGGFSDRYGSLSGSRDGDTFRDNYRDSELHRSVTNENETSKSKKPEVHQARDQDSLQSNSKPSTKPGFNPPKTPSVQANSSEVDFDDFDPRGSSKTGSTNTSSSQVDLFGQSLVGNLMDEPVSLPTEENMHSNPATTEVDLFADATFQSASPQAGATATSHTQGSTDVFASQPAIPAAFPSNKMDFFAAPDPGLPYETKSPISEPADTKMFDPFSAIPLNNFESSDLFGAFTSHSEPATTKPSQHSTTSTLNKLDETFGAFTSHTEAATTEPLQHSTNNRLNNLDQTSLTEPKPATKKNTFQVKSGIWADSLSRGLIDLNITAPKKVNLADIGIVGGLSDGSDEKEKGLPSSAYIGRAMGSGTGLGKSGFPSSTAMGGSGNFSTLGPQQFGSFK